MQLNHRIRCTNHLCCSRVHGFEWWRYTNRKPNSCYFDQWGPHCWNSHITQNNLHFESFYYSIYSYFYITFFYACVNVPSALMLATIQLTSIATLLLWEVVLCWEGKWMFTLARSDASMPIYRNCINIKLQEFMGPEQFDIVMTVGCIVLGRQVNVYFSTIGCIMPYSLV